jgi:hypothetical protein
MDDDAVDASSFQEAEDMDPTAGNLLTFGSVPETLQTSLLFAGLMAEMSHPALNVLTSSTSPVDPSTIQDATRTLLVTLPVAASLLPYFSTEMAVSIEELLRIAELQNLVPIETLKEEPLKANTSVKAATKLPLMPSLDLDNPADDKKGHISPTTAYPSSIRFNDPYSDNDNSLINTVQGKDDK